MSKLVLYASDETVIQLASDHDPVNPSLRITKQGPYDRDAVTLGVIREINGILTFVLPDKGGMRVIRESEKDKEIVLS